MWAGAWAALIGPPSPHPTASRAGHPRGRVSPTRCCCPAQGRRHLVAGTAHLWSQELLQGGSRGEAPLSAAAPCWDHIPSTTQGPPSSPGGSPWPVSEVLVLPDHPRGARAVREEHVGRPVVAPPAAWGQHLRPQLQLGSRRSRLLSVYPTPHTQTKRTSRTPSSPPSRAHCTNPQLPSPRLRSPRRSSGVTGPLMEVGAL